MFARLWRRWVRNQWWETVRFVIRIMYILNVLYIIYIYIYHTRTYSLWYVVQCHTDCKMLTSNLRSLSSTLLINLVQNALCQNLWPNHSVDGMMRFCFNYPLVVCQCAPERVLEIVCFGLCLRFLADFM